MFCNWRGAMSCNFHLLVNTMITATPLKSSPGRSLPGSGDTILDNEQTQPQFPRMRWARDSNDHHMVCVLPIPSRMQSLRARATAMQYQYIVNSDQMYGLSDQPVTRIQQSTDIKSCCIYKYT